MRLLLINGYGQLQAILGSISETNNEELGKELKKWLKAMGQLNKECMNMIKPGPRIIKKGNFKSSVDRVMKFQGITNTEIEEAVKLLM
jgi:hypothetical protein